MRFFLVNTRKGKKRYLNLEKAVRKYANDLAEDTIELFPKVKLDKIADFEEKLYQLVLADAQNQLNGGNKLHLGDTSASGVPTTRLRKALIYSGVSPKGVIPKNKDYIGCFIDYTTK